MNTSYLKQSITILKENPLLNIISIIGTAFAIAMIMVIVIAYEVKTANYRPETKRNRTLVLQIW